MIIKYLIYLCIINLATAVVKRRQTFGTVASSVMGLILGLKVNDPGLRGSLKRKVWL